MKKKGIYLSTEHDIAQSSSLNKNTNMCGKKVMRAIMMLLHRWHWREQGQGCKYFIKNSGSGIWLELFAEGGICDWVFVRWSISETKPVKSASTFFGRASSSLSLSLSNSYRFAEGRVSSRLNWNRVAGSVFFCSTRRIQYFYGLQLFLFARSDFQVGPSSFGVTPKQLLIRGSLSHFSLLS